MVDFKLFLGGVVGLESGDIPDIKMRLFLREALLSGLQRMIFGLFAGNDLILLVFIQLDD